jgi:uncharacterized protein
VFLIPTYLTRSPIHGLGVFTPVQIPAGTVIWKLDPEFDWQLTEADLEQFPEAYRDKLQSYLYLDESGFYILCGDNARYMNHSDNPNCDDTGSHVTVTAREIAADEELTCDYRSFDIGSRQDGLNLP